MNVTIELSPEIKAGLSTQAAARGLPLPEYLRHLIEEHVPVQLQPLLSPTERAAAWRDTKHFPSTPLLSNEAISRESIYGSSS